MGIVNNRVPCYNCSERASGCHSNCDRYKAFTQERITISKERTKQCMHYGATKHAVSWNHKAKLGQFKGR